MLTKYQKTLFILIFFFVPVSAFPAASDQKTITIVQILSSGDFIIYFDSAVHANCTTGGTNSVYVVLNQNGVSATGLASLLSTTLSSFHASTEVKVVFDETLADCYVSQIYAYK